LELSGLWNMR